MADLNFTPKTATEAIVARTLADMGGTAITKRAGYTYINGSLVPKAIAPVIARAIRAGRIIRPGKGMTEDFVSAIDPRKVNSVAAQIQTNVGVRARTIRDNLSEGTAGNDGMINKNAKIIPSTTPFEIPLRQLEDQAFFFPQMQLETMLFDEVTETIANYMDNVTNGIDAYHMAKALSFSMYRGAIKLASGDTKTDATKYKNIITVNKDNLYDEIYAVKMLNNLTAKLANGDQDTQLMTFTGPRELVARPELISLLKTPKTGFVLNSDIATKLFYEPNFDMDEALRVGSQYRGNVQGYDMEEAPQGIWTLVEKWLGLNSGDLDGVLGIVFTPQAYAAGGVGKKEVRMLQSTDYDGVVAFPYIKYGGTSYRIQYIIAYDTWTVPAKLQNAKHAAPVKAPSQWYEDGFEPIEKVIYDGDGNPVGMQTIANVLKPNGSVECAVNLTVTGTAGAAVNNAVVTVTSDGLSVPVTNNTDGTYTFFIGKGAAATVAITATGYKAGSATVTAANTKKDAYALSVSLTAN